MSKRSRYKRTFGITIFGSFVLLFLLTVVPIIYYTQQKNSETILTLSEDLISNVTATVIEKAVNYLSPAAEMASLSSRLSELGTITIADDLAVEKFGIEVLRTYPQLAMFNMGYESGNFVMPKKMPDGTIATKLISRKTGTAVEIWKHRDPSEQIVSTKETVGVAYDPRIRPWYTGAKSAGGLSWSDIYIFYSDQKPGITASHPVLDGAGELLGVVSLDIGLGELSNFLQNLKVGKNGIALIINHRFELVAYPDPSRVIQRDGEKLRPARIDEIGVDWTESGLQKFQETGSQRFSYTHNGTRYMASATPFPESFDKNWTIVVLVPENDFIGAARKTSRIVLVFSVFMVAFGLLCSMLLARQLSKPLVALTRETRRIRQFELDGVVDIRSNVHEVQLLASAIASMKLGLAAFEKYVPAELVRQLIKTGEDAKLGGKNEELTLFFSDIEGFSSISEGVSAQDLTIHMSAYFDELTNIIMDSGGTVDKFIGDAVMAFWGAPIADEDRHEHACMAAVRIQERLAILNRDWANLGLMPLKTRIGIHTGRCVVGSLGSSRRLSYTAIGDNVNVASRVEGLNKIYGTSIIVTESTAEKIRDKFILRELDSVVVTGRQGSTRIYELMERCAHSTPQIEALCKGFAEGINLYQSRQWQDALVVFRKLAEAYPEDPSSRLYVDRCRQYVEAPPGDDWDGVFRVIGK